MSMNMGWGDVTLVPNASGSTATGTWKHPFQVEQGNATAEQVELDDAPEFYWLVRKTAPGGAAGVLTITVTKIGFTVTSTHVNETGVIRAYGLVRALPQWWQS